LNIILEGYGCGLLCEDVSSRIQEPNQFQPRDLYNLSYTLSHRAGQHYLFKVGPKSWWSRCSSQWVKKSALLFLTLGTSVAVCLPMEKTPASDVTCPRVTRNPPQDDDCPIY